MGTAIEPVVDFHAHFFGDRAHQVSQRHLVLARDMAGVLDAQTRAAGKNRSKIFLAVGCGAAVGRAPQGNRMIEHRAVSFPQRLQFVKEVNPILHLPDVDLRPPLELFFIVAVMRDDVKIPGRAAIFPGEGTAVQVVADVESGQSRAVGLQAKANTSNIERNQLILALA